MPRFCRALVELELSAAQQKYDVRTGWAILKNKTSLFVSVQENWLLVQASYSLTFIVFTSSFLG